MQTMAAAATATVNNRIRGRQGDGNHGITQQGDEPAHRTTEALLTAAPAHESPALKRIEPLGNAGLKQGRAVLPRRADAGEQAGTLRRVTGFKVLRIHPTAFGKADGRRPWLTIHQRLGDGRTLAIFLKIRLCVDQITHFHQKTARRSRDCQRTVIKPQLLQIGANTSLQLLKS